MATFLRAAHEDDPSGTADRLITEFGSLGATLAARSEAVLRVIPGRDHLAWALKVLRAASIHVQLEQVHKRPVMANWDALLAYLRAALAFENVECIHVLHLDVKNRLIRDERIGRGTIDQCRMEVREIIARALELGAASLILVHNHPSGDLVPSRADIDVTRAVIKAGAALGIAVHDHVIVSPHGHSSMRSEGLI